MRKVLIDIKIVKLPQIFFNFQKVDILVVALVVEMCSTLQNSSISPHVYLLPSNTTVLSLNNSATSYPHGSTAQLKCDSSKYRPVGGILQSVCQFGKWSVDKLNCEPSECF